ncbi:hypothetical protein ACTFIV_008014 [Dictyostelium citrinum]
MSMTIDSDEENLTKLLQAFSNCNYIEFVKVFSVVHGFDATLEFCKNCFVSLPFMALKRKFGMYDDEKDQPPQQQQLEPPPKRQGIRSTWEDDSRQEYWKPKILYDSDDYFQKYKENNNNNNNNNKNIINNNNNNNSIINNSNNRINTLGQINNNINSDINNINNNNLNRSINNSNNINIVNSNNSIINNNFNFNQQPPQRRSSKKRLKPASSYTTCIEDLPFEVLIHIFSFLKYSDILIVSLVCKEWNSHSLVATTELTIENRKALSVDLVNRRIYKHSNYLKKIRCCQCKLFNSQSIRMIIDNCVSLSELQLFNCQLIKDAEIELVCSKLPKLTKMVIHSENLTFKSLESLSRSKLQEIELGGFSRVPIEAFGKLSEIQTLRKLDVSALLGKNANQLTFELGKCTNLTSLRLGSATESSLANLPFLGNLTLLSIGEWRLEDVEHTTTNQETMSTVTTISSSSSDGGCLRFLDQCKKIEKLEITGSEDFILRDLSYIHGIADTLKVLDLDFSYCNELDGKEFKKVFSSLVRLESLFISKFNLSGECWEAFSKMPNLYALSICCVKMNTNWVNRGLEHLGHCRNLQKLSIINSTEHWIDINDKSFSNLLQPRGGSSFNHGSFQKNLLELRLGGSRGGGWVLNEGVFRSIGQLKSLQSLDLSNSRGISEQCFIHLSNCPDLESLEGSIRVEENIVRSTIAEWCGTGTLINCPSLRKVSIDVKLPHFINSEIRSPNNLQQTTTNNGFNLMAKISKDHNNNYLN